MTVRCSRPRHFRHGITGTVTADRPEQRCVLSAVNPAPQRRSMGAAQCIALRKSGGRKRRGCAGVLLRDYAVIVNAQRPCLLSLVLSLHCGFYATQSPLSGQGNTGLRLAGPGSEQPTYSDSMSFSERLSSQENPKHKYRGFIYSKY